MSEHIINILEGTRFASLSDNDHSRIRAHSATCEECARAYKLASVSASMLENRMVETFEPSPFFHTRVLAALREQQNEGPAFARLWRAAGALVSSMAAAVVLFAVLSFAVFDQTLPTDASLTTAYSPEAVILNDFDEEQTDGQVLSTLYAADE
ncbi:MAG TPA: hypothetical protein VJV03_15535 [Pyrinomonadaceae bacterium]|nr:hypothetical protein [Pyrinomonadaceae bacterium]